MAHRVIGKRHMKIPNDNGTNLENYSCYTPTMPKTVISPGEVVHRHWKLYESNTIYCDEDEQTGCVPFHSTVSNCDVIMNTQFHNKKAFTLPLVPTSSTTNEDTLQEEINYMTDN
eukprot:15343407-Ditylum_brightwellii.AAC.1